MPTIDNPRFIYELVKNNGYYPEDPQVYTIWTYFNNWGNRTYAIFYKPEHDMFISPDVHNPCLLWSINHGLTIAGDVFLFQFEHSKM